MLNAVKLLNMLLCSNVKYRFPACLHEIKSAGYFLTQLFGHFSYTQWHTPYMYVLPICNDYIQAINVLIIQCHFKYLFNLHSVKPATVEPQICHKIHKSLGLSFHPTFIN